MPTLGPDEIEILQAGQTVTGVKLLPDGTREPIRITFTDADVDTLVETYNPPLRGTANLTADHRQTGPSYGLFDRVRKEGQSFIAHLSHAADIAREAIRTKAYTRGSAEILPDHMGARLYFKGFSLLGAQWPAFSGMAPITLQAAGPVLLLNVGMEDMMAETPTPVVIVPEPADYQPGALKNALDEDAARARTNTVLDKAWGLICRLWNGAGLTPPDKLAKVQAVLNDAAPLIGDQSVQPTGGGMQMYGTPGTEEESMDQKALEAAVTAAVAPLRQEFATATEALKTEVAAARADSQAAKDEAVKHVRRQAILTFAADERKAGRLIPAESEIAFIAFCEAIAPLTYAVADPKAEGGTRTVNALEFFQGLRAVQPGPRVPVVALGSGIAAVTMPAKQAMSVPTEGTPEQIEFAQRFNALYAEDPTQDPAALAGRVERELSAR